MLKRIVCAKIGNFVSMAKVKIHIGKKIREVLDEKPISVVDFAKSISTSRNSAYQIFDRATIDTGQLQTIGEVLNYDFFRYYTHMLAGGTAQEEQPGFGYATKAEVAELAHAILKLTIAIERIEEQLPKKKAPKKKYEKKNP